MEDWFVTQVLENWWFLFLLAINIGGFVMYAKLSVKDLTSRVNEVAENLKNVKRDTNEELRELRQNIEAEIREIKTNAASSVDKIVAGFRAALYNQDGQSIYMPRSACDAKAQHCVEHIESIYNTKVDAIYAKIEGLCQNMRMVQEELISQRNTDRKEK